MAGALNIVLVAEEAAGMQALRLLAGSQHRAIAVLTGSGTGMTQGATVAGLAQRLGFPVWPLRQVREKSLAERIRDEQVDLLLNVHSLCLLPAELVAAPRIGSFNLHPGPLPAYAGLNAPSWAIYHGERSHGVTVHWMDRGIDTGPIAYEQEIEIAEDDTGFSLSAKCVRAGIPLLEALLHAAAVGAIPRRPQSAQARHYYGREVPQKGRLDWTLPAARVVDFVRACDYLPFQSPWGRPRARVGGAEISILKAIRTSQPTDAVPGTVGQLVGDNAMVAAADEWVLVRRVQCGQSTLPAAAVLRPGQRFDAPLPIEESSSAAR